MSLTSSETYALSTHLPHTFTLTAADWNALTARISDASSTWLANLNADDDTAYIRTHTSDTYILTITLLLHTAASLCRQPPTATSPEAWHALRSALLAPQWAQGLSPTHLDWLVRTALALNP